ncbi:MAG: hypothetical protein WC449_03230 [Candidatus Paceibacterota bacterium]
MPKATLKESRDWRDILNLIFHTKRVSSGTRFNALEVCQQTMHLFQSYIGLDPFRFRTVEAILPKDRWAKNYLEDFVKARNNPNNKEVCSHLLFVRVVTAAESYDGADNSCPACRQALDLLCELYHSIKHHNRSEERQAMSEIKRICPEAERHGNTDTITAILKNAINTDFKE